MKRGPMSRMKKVPVKCSNCGKIKYNVVYEEESVNSGQEEIKEEVKQEVKVENIAKSLPPTPPRTHYIRDIVANQARLAQMYEGDE